MNRIFERRGRRTESKEEKQGSVIKEKIKVGVVGCSSGAGTSFIATSLAYTAARISERNVAFVQIDTENHHVYDALGMDKRFIGREFTDFYRLIEEEKSIKGIANTDEHINWALIVPDDNKKCLKNIYQEHKERIEKSVKTLEIAYQRLINNIAGDFVVCDFGSGEISDINEEIRCRNKRELYFDMDVIVCVVDPLPSRLLAGSNVISHIKSLQLKGFKVIWIINKDNRGVNKRELFDFLKVREIRTIPFMEAGLFYSSEYNCELPASNPQISKTCSPLFESIISECLHLNVIFL